MQIKIDLKILFFALIFFITNQFNIYVFSIIFIFFHELGHLIVAKLLKFKVNRFEIKPIGFSIGFSQVIEDYNNKFLKANVGEIKKIMLYFAGPFINLIIAAVLGVSNFNFDYKIDIIYINLILFVFNMLPIFPLDGGRIIKSFIYIFKGIEKSYIFIEKVSNVCMFILLFISSFAILYYENIAIVFAIIYIFYLRIFYSKINERKLILYRFALKELENKEEEKKLNDFCR